MAQIGTFTRGDDGSFTGQIRTLNINTKATIRPVAKDGERSPDYRVAANGVELGAGWGKAAKDSRAPNIVSVKLDDPSFTAPVYATLVARREGRAPASSGPADRPAAPRPERGAAPSHPGIMRSATIAKPTETLGFNRATPHNTSLRIIGLMWCTA